MDWNRESEFIKPYLSEYDRGYQDGSKETAEKILKFVLNMSHFDLDGVLIFPVSSLRTELSKQLGIEMKE